MVHLYYVLTKNTCKFNEETGIWSIDLPREFVSCPHADKRITILNFTYYATWIPRTDAYIKVDHTSFHSPTLCDGNLQQENFFITTISYESNTVHKTYFIRSHCEKLEFFFEDADGNVIKQFYVPKGESGYDDRAYEERFAIELLLEC